MKVLTEITSPYSAMESWTYDRFIAPAVAELIDAVSIEVPEGARVLDVGCGGGQVLAALQERRPDLVLSGVDLSPEQVGRAAKRTGLPVVQGSALDLPFDAGAFDGALSVASIKHWPDPTQGLAEMGRVVRSGGRVLVVEADRGCRLPDAKAFVDRWRLPAPARVVALAAFRTWVAGQSLSADELRAHAEAAGLEQVSVRTLPGLPAITLEAVAT